LIGLQQARLLREQKRVADELDQRVAKRTAELAAANEVLRKEVAERRRAEEALAASEHNLRLIVDGIPGLVSLLTPAGEVELVNPQLGGVRRQDIRGIEALGDKRRRSC